MVRGGRLCRFSYYWVDASLTLSVILSESEEPAQRETEDESKNPEGASFSMPRQGILPKNYLRKHIGSGSVTHGENHGICILKENSLKPHGRGHTFGILRLAVVPRYGAPARSE